MNHIVLRCPSDNCNFPVKVRSEQNITENRIFRFKVHGTNQFQISGTFTEALPFKNKNASFYH